MDKSTYIRIAYWYYTLGITQEEIGKRLSLTRQKVNQIIKSLETSEIVSFDIHGYYDDNIELECSLEERFTLRQAIVVSGYGTSRTFFYRVADAAAEYLNENILQGHVVGVTWGKMLSQVVEELPFSKKKNCKVVQMVGDKNIAQTAEKSVEIVRCLANKLDCPSYMLYSSVMVDHPETKEWLLKERAVKETFDLMKKCDIAVLGAGELTKEATSCTRGYLTEQEIEELQEQGFIADFAMNPIREDGSYDNCSLSDRIINVDMECLRGIDNVVMIAGGQGKINAIRAILKTGCVNTFITDEMTARQI